MQRDRIVFHTFNALRFFAFFRVFLLHLPEPEVNSFLHSFIWKGGGIGVDFFFVLSGFLITYLLAYEQLSTGRINARNYFLRRSLRIWPLYFLGVALAYSNNFITEYWSLGSQEGYDPNPLFSLTFLENYQMIARDNFPNGAPLRVFWSLCVEEHFYLLWLLLFLCIPVKHLPRTFAILWLVGIAYRIGFYRMFPAKEYYDIDVVSKLDYFCAGGMAGFVVAKQFDAVQQWLQRIPAFVRNGWTILVIVFFFGYQLFFEGRINDLYFPVISATLFAGLLLLVATSTCFLHIKETHVLSRLGKISYGLYVYHTLVILTLLAIAKKAGITVSGGLGYLVVGILSFAGTVLISHLSYRYFESYFLGLKKKKLAA